MRARRLVLRSLARSMGMVVSIARLAACGGPNLPSELSWESEHFVYKARAAETDSCPDVVQGLEEHFRVMQAAVGFDWPVGQKVTYYKFIDAKDLHANSDCGQAAGCAPGYAAETSVPFDRHELVHAYLRATGYPPRLLLEGAAVALSCGVTFFPAPTIPWQEAYALDTDGPRSGELYGAGGWLVGFLVKTRPAASFIELYRGAGHGDSAQEFASRFQTIYGESLDDVWVEAVSEARPPITCPWECGRSEAVSDGVTPVSTAAVCGFSPIHTLALAEDAEVLATLTGGSVFSLQSCGEGNVPPITYWAGEDRVTFVDHLLTAGRYFIDGPEGTATLTLDARTPGTWINAACATAPTPPPWIDLKGALNLVVPPGTWQVDLNWSSPKTVLVFPPNPSSEVWVCPACGSGIDACVASTGAAAFSEDVQGPHTLRVLSTPAPGGPDLAGASLTAPF